MQPTRQACVLALALAALATPGSGRAQTLGDPRLAVETVASGIPSPTSLAFLAHDDLLVLERTSGRVRRVLGGALLDDPVLDVAVNGESERGLLGIAVNSEDPPAVFLFYTEAATDGGTAIANRVYRYHWDPVDEALESPTLVLDLPVTPGPNHDGGVLLLGPPGEAPGVGDGALLYAVIGDLNRDNQLENFPGGAPPDDTAVILRVRQDGTPAPGNPFTPYCSISTGTTCSDDTDCPGAETCTTEVARYFAYGVRNSFGMALDPETGFLWDTENGPGSYDELNRVPAGFNSGWQQLMGPDARDPGDVGDLFDMPGAGSIYSDPEFSWLSTIAPTALVFPSGSALPTAFDDRVFVGDFNLGQLYAFPLNGARDDLDLSGFAGVADRVADSAAERDQLRIGSGFGGSFSGITDLEIGPDGALYVLAISGGTLYRIHRAPGVPALGAGALALLALLLGGATAAALLPRPA